MPNLFGDAPSDMPLAFVGNAVGLGLESRLAMDIFFHENEAKIKCLYNGFRTRDR